MVFRGSTNPSAENARGFRGRTWFFVDPQIPPPTPNVDFRGYTWFFVDPQIRPPTPNVDFGGCTWFFVDPQIRPPDPNVDFGGRTWFFVDPQIRPPDPKLGFPWILMVFRGCTNPPANEMSIRVPHTAGPTKASAPGRGHPQNNPPRAGPSTKSSATPKKPKFYHGFSNFGRRGNFNK